MKAAASGQPPTRRVVPLLDGEPIFAREASYLDELVFRFNRRRTSHAAFKTLLGIGVTIQPATYNMLIPAEGRG